jgi:hypothetical protein
VGRFTFKVTPSKTNSGSEEARFAFNGYWIW